MNTKNIIIATLASTIILTSCGSDEQEVMPTRDAVKVTTVQVKKTEQFDALKNSNDPI